MKKIILSSYYYKPHIGGIENSLFNLANELINLNCKVIVICSDKGLKRRKRLPVKEKIDNINIERFKHFIPIYPIFHFLTPLVEGFRIFFLLKKYKNYDINITRNYLLALITTFFKFKSIYILPGIIKKQDYLEFRDSKKKSFYNILKNYYRKKFMLKPLEIIQRFAINRVDKVGVFSDQLISQLRSENYIRNIVKLFPGVDSNKFHIAKHKNQLKRSLGFGKNKPVYLILGRLTVHKRFDIAIDAYKKNYLEGQAILLIVGDGPEKDNLVELAQSRKDIVFKKSSLNPEIYYQVSDYFLMTSEHETFGQTILESLACGCILLAFKSSEQTNTATSEILGSEIKGYTCNWNNFTTLIKNHKSLHLSENYNKIREENSRKIISKYSWNLLSSNILKVLNNE